MTELIQNLGADARPRGNGQPILFAEENEDAILLFYEGFKSAGLENPLFVVFDGQHAIDYLAGRGRFRDRENYPLPCLLLLSTDLADKNALEVLEWVRAQDEPVKALPTVLLANDPQPGEMKRALDLQAYDYLPKRLTPAECLEWSKSIREACPHLQIST